MTAAPTTSAVALVTGAGRGMGAEIARVLAADGFSMAVADIQGCASTADDIRSAGSVACAYECDIRDWDAVAALMTEVERDLGPLKVCVQVVGVTSPVPFLQMDPASWRKVLDVNLDGTFNVCRLAAERIAGNGGGSIVAISSTAARFTWSNAAHYSVSKAAIEQLVRSVAFELGGRAVRVNAVAPGTVRTPSTAGELDAGGEASEAAAAPLGRVGLPMDVAQAVRFLCDETRSPWVTGSTLLVDGGYSTHGEGADFGSTIDNTVKGES
jgi:NAD(P)-dependent dehydrogenase (short-subunit alcohol dehydrogenase family)